MTYVNPSISPVDTIGLDAAITKLQTALGALTWLVKPFHRAYIHREIQDRRTVVIPKVWQEGKEWYNCLPNDNVKAQSFFFPTSDERVSEYNQHESSLMECDMSLIVWVNTEKLTNHTTGPSLASEKADVMAILQSSDVVMVIESMTDRAAPEIFDPFTINDQATHLTMLPFAGFRVNFTVKFDYSECSPSSS